MRASPPSMSTEVQRGSAATPPKGTHEWLSLEDPDEERTWLFDVTFLTSNWTCIYGRGCPGILSAPAPEWELGCCSYGAHFVDDDDAARVERAAKSLGDDEWQFKGKAKKQGPIKEKRNGEKVTRLVDDACIFLNRPGFAAGPGCALHQAALRRGKEPLELKPEVCWQVPVRREDLVSDDGYVTSVIAQWDRRHWGPGGQEFHWWCTEEPEAFVGHRRVFEEMEAELTAMMGKKIYRRLGRALRARDQSLAEGVALPHPVVRRNGSAS
jgi:hypothetical protein